MKVLIPILTGVTIALVILWPAEMWPLLLAAVPAAVLEA